VLRWTLGITPEASTIGSLAMRRRALSTSRLSQPAWHVTRIARSPWRMESDGVLSAWQGHRHIAVLPDQVPPRRVTRARNSEVGLLLTRGMPSQPVPAPLPVVNLVSRSRQMDGPCCSIANRYLIFQKSITTPLLAAEGFMILRIQIQGPKSSAISSQFTAI
jgi:hypothetical protein